MSTAQVAPARLNAVGEVCMKKDLLAIADLSTQEVLEILQLTEDVKKDRLKYSEALKGKSMGLIFQKPSNRTRVSF